VKVEMDELDMNVRADSSVAPAKLPLRGGFGCPRDGNKAEHGQRSDCSAQASLAEETGSRQRVGAQLRSSG
jgi:radical SAM superfamily enzyme